MKINFLPSAAKSSLNKLKPASHSTVKSTNAQGLTPSSVRVSPLRSHISRENSQPIPRKEIYEGNKFPERLTVKELEELLGDPKNKDLIKEVFERKNEFPDKHTPTIIRKSSNWLLRLDPDPGNLKKMLEIIGSRIKVSLDRVYLSGRDLSGADLSGITLFNANLRKANLAGSNLSGANLTRVDLVNANLSDANLTNTSIRSVLGGANLARADLSYADLSESYVAGANLSGANLGNAVLEGTDLAKADLSRANLVGAKLNKANFYQANSTEANFCGADLSGANLLEANFDKAKLVGADLSMANLMNVSLKDANLLGADLEGANLRNADLEGANLANSNLTEAKLERTIMRGANLAGACLFEASGQVVDLRGANLRGADLQSANFSKASNPPVIVRFSEESNFSGANLTDANLTNANLTNTNLQDTNFSGANLTDANFSGANLTNVNFSGANLETIEEPSNLSAHQVNKFIDSARAFLASYDNLQSNKESLNPPNLDKAIDIIYTRDFQNLPSEQLKEIKEVLDPLSLIYEDAPQSHQNYYMMRYCVMTSNLLREVNNRIKQLESETEQLQVQEQHISEGDERPGEDQSDGLGGLPIPDRNPQPNNNPQGDGGAEAGIEPQAPAREQHTQDLQAATGNDDLATLTDSPLASSNTLFDDLAVNFLRLRGEIPASVGINELNFDEPTLIEEEPIVLLGEDKVVEVPAQEKGAVEQLTSYELPARQIESVPVSS